MLSQQLQSADDIVNKESYSQVHFGLNQAPLSAHKLSAIKMEGSVGACLASRVFAATLCMGGRQTWETRTEKRKPRKRKSARKKNGRTRKRERSRETNQETTKNIQMCTSRKPIKSCQRKETETSRPSKDKTIRPRSRSHNAFEEGAVFPHLSKSY